MPRDRQRRQTPRLASSHPRECALESSHHLGQTAFLHALHHGLHLFKLAEQAIDLLNRNAGAGSDPALWREILASNRTEVLAALRSYRNELDCFVRALETHDDEEVAARLERGRAYRAGMRPPPPAPI